MQGIEGIEGRSEGGGERGRGYVMYGQSGPILHMIAGSMRLEFF